MVNLDIQKFTPFLKRQDFEGGELILGGVDEEKMMTNLTWVTW